MFLLFKQKTAYALRISDWSSDVCSSDLNPDWNGASDEGTIWTQLAMTEGRRVTAATAYLDPVRGRTNLGVLTDAQAMRVLIDDRRARHILLRHGGADHVLHARREIVLADRKSTRLNSSH